MAHRARGQVRRLLLASSNNPIDAHVVYAAGSRDQSAPLYVSTFPGGETAPGSQAGLPTQTNSTPAGAAGFRWHEVVLEKTGSTVTWTVDNVLLVTVDMANFATPTAGANILFGMSDTNQTTNANASLLDQLQFTLIDNVVVENEQISPTFTISGRIATSNGTAISGVSVSRGAGSTPVLTDSNGNYVFTAVPAGSYTLTPNKSGYAFSPATRNVTVGNANITGQNFTGTNSTLSGRIAFSNGTGIAGVQVRLGTGRSVLTNNAGYYTFTGMLNGAYTLTPVLAGYSFDPALRSVTITNASVGNINFTGGFAINGRIANSQGTGLVGLRVYRSGSSGAAVTNSAGYFAFYGVTNGTYTLTPDVTQGYGYTPPTRSVTINGASVNNQNFIATSGCSISGRIATSNGTGIGGVNVSRTGSATPVTTNSAGYYTFYGVTNGTYTVSPSKSGTTFTPATKNVTVNGANVANQNFVGSGQ